MSDDDTKEPDWIAGEIPDVDLKEEKPFIEKEAYALSSRILQEMARQQPPDSLTVFEWIREHAMDLQKAIAAADDLVTVAWNSKDWNGFVAAWEAWKEAHINAFDRYREWSAKRGEQEKLL